MQMRFLIASFFTLLFLQSGISQVNSLDQFFNTYQEDPDFTVVSISPKLFQMFSKLDLDEESEDLKSLVSSINSLRILVRDSMDGRGLYEDAFTQLSNDSFDELLTVRDGSENVRFLIREGSNDIIKQLVLLVGGANEFVLLDIAGNIDLQTVGKLGKTLDIPGGEHLEKVGKK